MTSTAEKVGYRWFRVSLRTLFVLLTALCIWLGFNVSAAYRQKKAVHEIKANVIGNTSPQRIEYSFQFDSQGQPISNSEPPWPVWLRDALGEDLFITVIGVNLDKVDADDNDLNHLKGLPYLKRLDLESTSVTDAGLKLLADLEHLMRLDLQETQVTNEGLRHISELTELRVLLLGDIRGNSGIGDAGLTHLKGLSRLEHLGLRYTNVGNDGLRNLAGLTNLESLDLAGTNVTAEGVAALQKVLPKCKISLVDDW